MDVLRDQSKILSSSSFAVGSKEGAPRPISPEKVSVVEVGRVNETSAEKEGLVERVDKEAVELPKPVMEGKQVLVTSSVASEPKIILPVTRSFFNDPGNWHRPVVDAARWLLEWTKRIIKRNPDGRTVFPQ